MDEDFDEDEWPVRFHTYDRRHDRISVPECRACGHAPMHVDTRTADALYLRCQQCGQKATVAKYGPRVVL